MAAVMLIPGLMACRDSKDRYAELPVITVSIEPQRWLLEHIVGDHMQVRTLLDKGGNPESYEPTFSNMAELERSVCFMPVGHLPFESAIIDKLQTNNPDLRVVDISDSITLISDSHHGHDHGVDPHIWSSAVNAGIIARNMLRAVKSIDPDNADEYDKNCSRLIQHIDSVNAVCDSLLAPVRGSSFVVWHPSLSYFARDYGLHQISVGAEGKEHSISDTRRVIDNVVPENTRVFLVQKDFDATRADVISRHGNKIPVVTINPLNYDWDEELLHTAGAIAQ